MANPSPGGLYGLRPRRATQRPLERCVRQLPEDVWITTPILLCHDVRLLVWWGSASPPRLPPGHGGRRSFLIQCTP
jgi:hypothetical protein